MNGFVDRPRRGLSLPVPGDGLTEFQVLGTYGHVHPASGAFDAFVEAL